MDKKLVKIQIFTSDMELVREGYTSFDDTEILTIVINEDGRDVQLTQIVE